MNTLLPESVVGVMEVEAARGDVARVFVGLAPAVTPDSNSVNHSTHTPQSTASTPTGLTMRFMGSLSEACARVLLDTGAGGTFLSQAFAKRSNIAVVPSEGYSAATSANGSAVQVFGMAIVHRDLQGLHYTVRCLVADLGNDWDLIIGEPWLKQHHVVLSYDKLDAVVIKGSQIITLRCGTSDGVDVGFDPNDPTAAAVGNVPVLSPVQMHRLLQQPCHRMFVVHVSGVGPKPGVSSGAVSELASTDALGATAGVC